MIQSSAYVLVKGFDYQYHFCGVVSIEHSFSSQIATQEDPTLGTDYMNGARNEPNMVTLSVIESDAMRSSGWAARMVEVFESVKRNQQICMVVTPYKTYDNMILTEFTFEENEESQSGWSGSLTFTETKNFGIGKAQDNSSTADNIAAADASVVVSSDSHIVGRSTILRQILERSGIKDIDKYYNKL